MRILVDTYCMSTWINDDIGVLEGAVNIGIVNKEASKFIIDTGIDNSAINKVIKSINFDIEGALITHHHADHMGGCNKLESLGITKLFGPKLELELFTNPYLEPLTMFGGSHPPKKLRNRHLEAKPSKTIRGNAESTFGKAIETPGHTIGHTAYLVDDVLFSGDAAFTSETIEKYGLLFAINPQQAANSLDELEKINFSTMVPGHGPIAYDKKTALDVIAATRQHYKETRDKILSLITPKLQYSDFISRMMKELELDGIVANRGVTQYYLYQVPLSGYLSNLLDDGLLSLEINQNKMEITSN